MVSTTRLINWRTEPSRSEVSGLPWKYLLATILVAVCDQPFGTSTFSCLKMVAPFSLPMRAVRFSHSTLSKGETFPSVKYRSKIRPLDTLEVSTCFEVSTALPFNACFTVAILIPPRNRFPWCERGTILFYSPDEQGFTFPSRKHNSIRGQSGRRPPEIIEKNECAAQCRWSSHGRTANSTLTYNCAERVLRARFLR